MLECLLVASLPIWGNSWYCSSKLESVLNFPALSLCITSSVFAFCTYRRFSVLLSESRIKTEQSRLELMFLAFMYNSVQVLYICFNSTQIKKLILLFLQCLIKLKHCRRRRPYSK